jgi:hypothetical protein
MSGGGVPYTVPVDSEIMTKLIRAYKDITGITVQPCITYGGTYAAAWSNSKLSADTNETFGTRMVSWGIDGGIGMHEANESMSVEKLIEGTKIMARAMVYLATDSSEESASTEDVDSSNDDLSGSSNVEPAQKPGEPAPFLTILLLAAVGAALYKYCKK